MAHKAAVAGATTTDADHASHPIDAKIAKLGDRRVQTLARIRRLIGEAAPDIVEEVK